MRLLLKTVIVLVETMAVKIFSRIIPVNGEHAPPDLHPGKGARMTLLKVHRMLIVSGIIVCLLLAIRGVGTASEPTRPVTLIRVGCAVLGAVALGIYLRSLRSR